MPIRSTSTTRNLQARKSSVPTIGKGKPLDARGNEGDLTFRRSSEGLKLYIKANHKWHGIKVGESFDSLEKKINEIKSKVDTIKQFKLPSTYSVTGDFTLDVSGDIDLDADGGQVAIKDAGERHFLFDCDNTKFTIYDDQDAADTFNIQIAEHGATTITTVDGGADNANLGIDIDGAITLTSAGATILDANAFIRIDSRNAAGDATDGTVFRENGTTFAALTAHHAMSTFLMWEQGGAATNDYYLTEVSEHGATKLTTVDAAAAAAHFEIEADGTITLDAAAGVLLDSGDGRLYFQNAGTTFANIQVDTTSQIKLYEQGGATSDDYLKIETATHGATTITTVDAAAAAANLTMTIDGDITLDSADEIVIDHTNRLKFKKAGTEYARMDTDGSSQFTMYEQGGASTDDFFQIVCATHGATTLRTHDNAAHAADLMIKPDGSTSIGMEDGDSDNFKLVNKDNSDNIGVSFYLEDGAQTLLKMYEAGGNTNNDYFSIDVQVNGETIIKTVDANAKVAHLNIEPDGHVEFDGCGVGFDLVTPTYNASDTDVDFTTGNKQFVTFGSGDITDLNLIFPKTSGNFTLLLKQDGTGSRTVTNYKAWDIVNSDAASGSATVKFPGGTNPTLTTAANHVDIFSFFYDADNQIAYGVASLDFQD